MARGFIAGILSAIVVALVVAYLLLQSGYLPANADAEPGGLELWAEVPLNADYTYANAIDATADYMLSSADIEASAESGFTIARMMVAIGG